MISHLHYISQQTATAGHIANIQAACEAGCKWIQLRIKDAAPEDVLTTARTARQLCDQYGATLIINDYPQIAKAVNAQGVHVGKNDMTVAAAREITGADFIVGGTANTLDDILQHVKDGASYVGLGPYRFTTTKQKLSPVLGLEGIARIMQALEAQQVRIPIVAIGGILPEDVAALRAAGVHGVAVSGAITHAGNRQAVVDNILLTCLNQGS
ncbi:thiamine phosphate synthase [Chitinophaga japonensis]|uniref:Thiamine-phosphate synthase n=1 Tax=Chitinophaga japonensis TaxID=104662 RepID=A0A562TDL8_CHIJA|nr:thiamine phosphate synthase [Chitinophaga japonensis]TWI91609.1 thiamine-phosphate diphosphorylase [Chitinophaga japonensis]